MILYDKLLIEQGKDIISPFDTERVTNIAYDLTAESFSTVPYEEQSSVTLNPGDCVHVKSVEEIKLPEDMICWVQLRNSRIRQGLSLDAPIYQPGHHTKVFFRLINNSGQELTLKEGDGIASIILERLGGKVQKPYSGAFQNEFNYSGMSDYESVL